MSLSKLPALVMSSVPNIAAAVATVFIAVGVLGAMNDLTLIV
ncbi:hypothetical protein [Parvularcula oceani]|nr:hypothetical protein [Parvularcula oceani]